MPIFWVTLLSSISEFGETRPSLTHWGQQAVESPSPEVVKDRARISLCVLRGSGLGHTRTLIKAAF